MKKAGYIKEAMLLAVFGTVIFIVASCGFNSNKPDGTKVVAEERYDANYNNNHQQMRYNTAGERYDARMVENRELTDTLFLVNAAENSLEQIQLGQLAQRKGTAAHVKELGKTMEEAHTKALSDINALGKTKRITIPTSITNDARNDYEKLNGKSGNDFDKAYSDMMVSRHEDSIEAFEKVTEKSYDTDIKNWANGTLTDMRKHLDLSVECQKKCDKM